MVGKGVGRLGRESARRGSERVGRKGRGGMLRGRARRRGGVRERGREEEVEKGRKELGSARAVRVWLRRRRMRRRCGDLAHLVHERSCLCVLIGRSGAEQGAKGRRNEGEQRTEVDEVRGNVRQNTDMGKGPADGGEERLSEGAEGAPWPGK